MKMTYARSLAGAVGLVVLLAVLVMANAVVAPLRLRADLTSEKLYTLSDGTRQLLQGLSRDVTLKFYCTRSAEGLPITFKQYAERILDLLREYEAASGGRVELQVIDPRPDSDEEEWAQRYGLTGSRLDARGDGPAVYLGLVALSNARQDALPFISPVDEPQLEYLVTRLLSDVTTAHKPKLGLLSALPVMGAPGMMMNMNRGQDPWVFVQELRTRYEISELSAPLDEVPDDIDTVLLVHPRALPEIALFALDQFVLRGGHLIAFVDPLCLTEQSLQSSSLSDPQANRSDLNRLTSTWGVSMDADRVAADSKAATRLPNPDGTWSHNPAWLTLMPENLNDKEVATQPLDTLMLPMAGAFRIQPVDGVQVTPLITTPAGSGLMTSMEATMGTMAGATSLQRSPTPLNLAIRLAGKFKTAFPGGRPQDPDRPADVPGRPAQKAPLAESTREGVVVLVGDVDMLYDGYAVRRIPAYGRYLFQLANDNINFVANLVGQLSGSDILIGLRSRGTFERPFARVLDLQKSAQDIWRKKELALQEELRLTQMKVEELEAAKDPAQRMVVTPEQKRELEQFRQQIARTRHELKTVNKELRRDIERLGFQVKAVNLAAMPGLVVMFGLAYGGYRRWRARAR